MTEILDNPGSGSGDQEVQVQSSNIITAAEDKAQSVPQTWPDNWRQEMAAGDEKELKRLERFKAPTEVYKSYRNLENIKAAFVPPPKPPTAESKPEEVKAYREHYGIPDEPSKYDLSFDDGTAIGEDLMPTVEGFLKHAHSLNQPNDVVKANLKWYMDDLARLQEHQAELNYNAEIDGITELKAEWGGEYKGNINSIKSLFTDAPEGTLEALSNAVNAEGLKITNQTGIIRWMVDLAKKINPTASLLPSGATDSASIDTELDKLKSQMHSSDPVERDKYWKDVKAQDRFLRLTEAKKNTR